MGVKITMQSLKSALVFLFGHDLVQQRWGVNVLFGLFLLYTALQ